MKLFKENKNLDQYKREIINKYGTLGIASKKYNVGLSSLYNLFNGTQLSVNCHEQIAEDLKIPTETYYMYMTDVYKPEALNSNKLAQFRYSDRIKRIRHEGINVSDKRKETPKI